VAGRGNAFYVYILSSKSRNLYIGVTNDLERRVWEHKNKAVPGYTARYNIDRLVHVEEFGTAADAIAREKELKDLLRAKKIALIEMDNLSWADLSEGG
jgi:putative endonuclease